jgi:integrase
LKGIKMAIIEERKNSKGEKSFRAKIRLKGFPIQTATFSRKTDAKHWAQQTEAAMREGRYFNYTQSKTKTMNDLIDRYIDEILPLKSRKTIIVQTQQLGYWKETIGHLRIDEVKPSIIIAIRNELSKGLTCRGKKRSNATINRYIGVLLHAFNIAIKEWEWTHDNPCAKISKLKESRGRTRYLSKAELKRLLEACRKSGSPHLLSVVIMALSTGARKNEILSLQWKNVDLKRATITIEETKNGESRTIPIHGEALRYLTGLWQYGRNKGEYVFCRSDIDQPVCIRSGWRFAVKKAKIDNFCFHDLRHTAASYFAMNGATLTDIAEILGHKTIQMTKRYAHLHIDHTRKVVASMNDKMFSE